MSGSLNRVLIGWRYDHIAKKILAALKYKSGYKVAQEISELLAERNLYNNPTISKAIVIPVPVHKTRYNERGFNQAALIGRAISTLTECNFSDNLLIRSKHTQKQHSLNKEQRVHNMRNAFKLSKGSAYELKKYRKVIIVDDVITTGSTLDEISYLIKSRIGNIEREAICLFRGRPRYSLTDP
ncbi:ComF family protein [Candidatus Nomurabacteria bacterium]|nr:ComF family protein [Candidatus Nomurabacteria bacterium]